MTLDKASALRSLAGAGRAKKNNIHGPSPNIAADLRLPRVFRL